MFTRAFRVCRCLVRRGINTKNLIVTNNISCVSALRGDISNYSYASRNFSTSNNEKSSSHEKSVKITYDEVCEETLESLCTYFEELIEAVPNFKGADVIYGDGVLTVSLGPKYGTYVINRQKPNKQIWLSSPTSGPKRYDLVPENGGYWLYKHDGVTLHKLLQDEISKLTDEKVDFTNCTHSNL